MGKSAEWHAERRKGIGGSDAAKIMAGDWFPLWEEKTGRAEAEDLSWVLPVQIGVATEDLNRRWFEHGTGHVVSMDNTEGLAHPDHRFMRANLDGWIIEEVAEQEPHLPAILECKHVNQFSKDDEVVTRYFPQLQHYIAVTNTMLAHLSVFVGTFNWKCFAIGRDPDYQAELIRREEQFWRYVTEDTPPPDMDAVEPPKVAFDDMREVDLTGSNEWAAFAADWRESAAAAKTFNAAAKGLKDLTEADVKRAYGHGVETNRAKNGALRVKETKDAAV